VKNDVGDIDILINNAGIVSGKKILQCPDALIEKTMQVNVIAHFWVCCHFYAPIFLSNIKNFLDRTFLIELE